MQLTVRSYLMAGLAAAGAGALAIAPMPSATPADVKIPTVEAPVALAAAPSVEQLLTLGIADPAGLAAGVFGSASNANGFLGADTQLLGASFTQLAALVADDPETNLPLAAASLALTPVSLIDLTEPQFTGVVASGFNQFTQQYSQPGQADNTAAVLLTQSPGIAFAPTVTAPINAAAGKAAFDFDNVSATLGGPRLAVPLTSSAVRVGTSVVQAQGLVRSAGETTISGVATAALARNPQGVVTALQSAPGNFQKAVLGDPTAPLVNPTTGKVDADATKNTAVTVKRLGAIGTVSATAKKAASDVGNAISGGS